MKKLKKNNIVNFPSSLSDGEKEVEAILFAAAEPLDIDTIESKLPKKINVPNKRRAINKQKQLHFHKVSTNNLKDIDVNFPIGTFCCITGVSGSGKSSLIIDTVYPALSNIINKTRKHEGLYKKIYGHENFDKVINITQSPIGRTPRSNPVTYTGTFTPIRDWFALLPPLSSPSRHPSMTSFKHQVV